MRDRKIRINAKQHTNYLQVQAIQHFSLSLYSPYNTQHQRLKFRGDDDPTATHFLLFRNKGFSSKQTLQGSDLT